MDTRPSFIAVSSIDEMRVLEKSKSLLNWLTQRNFDKIKDEIVHTLRPSPSAFLFKSLVSCIFDMAMVENSYVLFARLCVELFHQLPPLPSDESHGKITSFERLFLHKCQIELQNASPETEQPPLVYVDESNFYTFIKTVRLLAEVFKNRKITETTRKSIIQVLMNPILPPERNSDAMNLFLTSIGKLADFQFSDENFNQISRAVELESNYNKEVKLRKEAEEALARNKEEHGKLQLHAQALEQKHEAELQLRKETKIAVAIELERIRMVEIQLETLENERDYMRLKAEEFESKYHDELVLRKESEIALDKERKETEGMKQQLETYETEQETLIFQVLTLQEKYDHESSVRKVKEDALSREKEELLIVRLLLESYSQEADAMRQERDNALNTAQEIVKERQPPPSFFCPITQEVMRDPHMAADGFTYEADDIKKWLSTGHNTSPMTNLKLSHLNLVPNRALRSAIQDLV